MARSHSHGVHLRSLSSGHMMLTLMGILGTTVNLDIVGAASSKIEVSATRNGWLALAVAMQGDNHSQKHLPRFHKPAITISTRLYRLLDQRIASWLSMSTSRMRRPEDDELGYPMTRVADPRSSRSQARYRDVVLPLAQIDGIEVGFIARGSPWLSDALPTWGSSDITFSRLLISDPNIWEDTSIGARSDKRARWSSSTSEANEQRQRIISGRVTQRSLRLNRAWARKRPVELEHEDQQSI
ncbi:hypothetical protein F4778DRAFT_796440 [Xylariomycetidae sp. FL2044]|nr:hypothetical protein F4778DRAFT_796440 [Xylariomycetidae sp. FL2044]